MLSGVRPSWPREFGSASRSNVITLSLPICAASCRAVKPSACSMHHPDEPLTQREREVVRMMAGGYSNREIGSALGVAERTVKNHVSSILAKLGVSDRTRAVLKALEKRLF